ncbi:MAG: carbohydrate kinase [Sphaerochaetaceae bacterium]|nr:carbohydrate kinase [Sphaerochaetaceae bacterium]
MIGFLGEALIDFISREEDAGSDPLFHYYAGGSTLNAATAASRLGSDALFLGKLSQDMFGQKMKEYFRSNNVMFRQELVDVPQNSMIGFAKIDETGAASYVFYTSDTSVTSFSAAEIVKTIEEAENLDYILIGSVSVALETSGEHIRNALKSIMNRPFIFFDPNVRPTVVEDFDRYHERMKDLASLSSIIKLSHEDLAFLYPDLSVTDGLNSLMQGNTQAIILTLGKDGLRWIDQQGRSINVPAIDNPIVDTVGAGDTVSGAVLTFLSEHGIVKTRDLSDAQITEMLEFAVQAAAVTTSRKGANPPLRSEVGSVL